MPSARPGEAPLVGKSTIPYIPAQLVLGILRCRSDVCAARRCGAGRGAADMHRAAEVGVAQDDVACCVDEEHAAEPVEDVGDHLVARLEGGGGRDVLTLGLPRLNNALEHDVHEEPHKNRSDQMPPVVSEARGSLSF